MQDEHANSITDFGKDIGLEWVMIPPRTPHFGGLWESAIKRMKHHLRRTVGNQILSQEELSTYVT